MKNTDEFLKLARERFQESADAESDNRENAILDMKMENGDQWTDDDEKLREGRPCCTDNRLAGAVKQITGDALLNRPSIKVRPVDSVADPLTAEIYTGLIRNIENISDAEEAYDTGHGCSVRGAIGYWRVRTDYSGDNTFDQDILIDRIVNPQSVYYDQGGIKKSYEDAEYCFVTEVMRKSKFEKEYPRASVATIDNEGQGSEMAGWFAQDTVTVAEYWYKEPYTKHIFQMTDGKVIEIKDPVISDYPDQGQQPVRIVQDGQDGQPMQYINYRKLRAKRVMQAIISGADILRDPQEWPGKYIPIVPCIGEEVWIEGQRILRSAIRHAIEPQRLHNWNVSNDMETKALSPKQPWLITEEQMGPYKGLWDMAYSRPMPYLLWKYVQGQPEPKRLGGSVSDSGAVQGIALSIDSIKAATGVFDASLGNRSNETSGIAIERRQRQTSASTYVFVDNQTKAIKYTGKILVDLIPKIYDSDRVIRLLGSDLKKKFQKQPVGPDGKPTINVSEDGFSAQVRINFKDPNTGKIYNDLSVGKYDIVVDAGPGYMTRRQEAADGMIQLGQAAPQFMPILVPRIARNLDWPDAEEIGDEIKQATQPPPQQGPSPKDQLDLAKGQQDLQKGDIELKGKQLDLVGKAQEIRKDMTDQQQQMAQIAQQVVFGTLRQLGVIR